MTESSVNLSLLKYQDQISPKALPSRLVSILIRKNKTKQF
jgi:hypothetical protein